MFSFSSATPTPGSSRPVPRTWLGFRLRARSAGSRAQAETPGRGGAGGSFSLSRRPPPVSSPSQCATSYLVRFPPARPQCGKQSAGGNARESRSWGFFFCPVVLLPARLKQPCLGRRARRVSLGATGKPLKPAGPCSDGWKKARLAKAEQHCSRQTKGRDTASLACDRPEGYP